jgi:hypothetical protein
MPINTGTRGDNWQSIDDQTVLFAGNKNPTSTQETKAVSYSGRPHKNGDECLKDLITVRRLTQLLKHSIN